jgi:hypothetical protein
MMTSVSINRSAKCYSLIEKCLFRIGNLPDMVFAQSLSSPPNSLEMISFMLGISAIPCQQKE